MIKSVKEYKNALEKLKLYAKHYYELDDPIASDSEYDELYKKIINFENENKSLIDFDSPTQRVGGEVLKDFSKNQHITRMWSLDDVFNESELNLWLKRLENALKKINNIKIENIEFCISPKYDGMSLNLLYENGKLISATTRGNGQEGELVTQNAIQIKNIPQNISIKEKIEIRGEVLISNKNFDNLNKFRLNNNQTPLANPRNAVAGSMRVLDSKITASRNLDFVAWGIGFSQKVYSGLFEILEILRKDFSVPLIFKGKANEIEKFYKQIYSINNNENNIKIPFMLDGVVVALNDFDISFNLGFTQKSPRFAFAYKFKPNEAVVKIEKISYQVGRTGVLTPVAEFIPTPLNGAHISRATLHNFEEIARKDIRVGDYCLLVRSGDVIPKITKVLIERRDFILNENLDSTPSNVIRRNDIREEDYLQKAQKPTNCPVCGSALAYEDIYIYCKNLNCDARLKNALKHFCSKEAMDIDGMGEKIVKLLVDKGLISKFQDIYKLKKEDLLMLDGFKEKKVNNLLEAIQRSKGVHLWRLIHALGILHIGVVASKEIAKMGLDFYLKEEAELEKIEGVGIEMIKSFCTFCIVNKDLIKELLEIIKPLVSEERSLRLDSKFLNKTIVITGTFELKRDKIIEKLESMGATITNSLSRKTDFLICGEDAGSKLDKALELGVRILKKDELEELGL